MDHLGRLHPLPYLQILDYAKTLIAMTGQHSSLFCPSVNANWKRFYKIFRRIFSSSQKIKEKHFW